MDQTWATGWDIREMVQLLRSQTKVSRRKLRLLTAAYLRRCWDIFPHNCFRRAVEAIEQLAEGSTSGAAVADDRDEVLLTSRSSAAASPQRPRLTARACDQAWDLLLTPRTPTPQLILLLESAASTAALAAWEALGPAQAEASVVEVCRDVCALLRCVFGNPFRPPWIDPAWLRWNAGFVSQIANEINEDRDLPGGTLDRHRLAVLADALEEAGCVDEGILGHLRGRHPHVRGCSVVDALIRRE